MKHGDVPWLCQLCKSGKSTISTGPCSSSQTVNVDQRLPVLQNMFCFNKIIMEKRERHFFSNDNGEHGGGARNTGWDILKKSSYFT